LKESPGFVLIISQKWYFISRKNAYLHIVGYLIDNPDNRRRFILCCWFNRELSLVLIEVTT